MTQTNTNTLTSATGPTADAARRTTDRKAAPRRWWRALDRMTLQTMSPPIPAHVRSALSDRDATFTEASDFAATVRAAAPGRSGDNVRSAAPSNAEFAAAIRAEAPGRRS